MANKSQQAARPLCAGKGGASNVRRRDARRGEVEHQLGAVGLLHHRDVGLEEELEVISFLAACKPRDGADERSGIPCR